MLRAALELLITIILVMAARAILTSFLKGIANSSSAAFQRGPQEPKTASGPDPSASAKAPKGNELHKDPVCGTYVAESTKFRRQAGGQAFYYCSESCKEKHALVAR